MIIKPFSKFLTITSLLKLLSCTWIFPITPVNYINESGNTYFTIQISIGSQPQKFNVQLDTSMSTSWVPSSKCKNCGKTSSYSSDWSSTAKPLETSIEIEDENGDVIGSIVIDDFSVNDKNVPQFGFVEVTEIDDDYTDHGEGKLGLGYRGELSHNFNFVEKLQQVGLVSNRIFSIQKYNDTYGELIVGKQAMNYDNYCNVTSTEDLEDEYRESWVCEITHINWYDSEEILFKDMHEIRTGLVQFDTGYDYISVPILDIYLFEQLLFKDLHCRPSLVFDRNGKPHRKRRNSEDEVIIICDKKKFDDNLMLTFVWQGVGYNIKLNLWFKENESNMEFLIRFIDDKEAIWTFGNWFMRYFHLIFDMENRRVGIEQNENIVFIRKSMLYFDEEWDKWDYLRKGTHIDDSMVADQIWKIISGVILVIVIIVLIWYFVRRCKTKDSLIYQENVNHAYDSDKVY